MTKLGVTAMENATKPMKIKDITSANIKGTCFSFKTGLFSWEFTNKKLASYVSNQMQATHKC